MDAIATIVELVREVVEPVIEAPFELVDIEYGKIGLLKPLSSGTLVTERPVGERRRNTQTSVIVHVSTSVDFARGLQS